MKRERWAEIQHGELAYHQAKDETKVLDVNLPYWRDLLAVLPEGVRPDARSRVLDLGCGGCGILLALGGGERVGVDPLMDEYLRKFPFLREHGKIEWIAGTAEEVAFDRPFDLVFSINAFDHVYDPRRVVGRIREFLRPGGHLVLTMNCHTMRVFRSYYAALYRWIDHHHPYQFTPDDVIRLFAGFRPVFGRDVDDLWFPYAERYARDVLRRAPGDRRRLLRAAFNPLKWPMGFCKVVLDMPPHRQRVGQRSIYTNRLFVFRREEQAAERPDADRAR